MRELLVALVVFLFAGAFVAGYWPQRERLSQARAEATELRRQLSEARSQVAEAEARARLGRLFGQFLALQDAVVTGNYGEAQTLSSPFFDQVREAGTGGLSRFLIYVASVVGEILLISAIYYFMPVGRLSAQHALIGGASAGLLWELIRHALGWYFGTLSQVSVVYGSLTTAIIVLLSLEVAATLLLLGAQVIAEYERIDTGEAKTPPFPMRVDA